MSIQRRTPGGGGSTCWLPSNSSTRSSRSSMTRNMGPMIVQAGGRRHSRLASGGRRETMVVMSPLRTVVIYGKDT
jgi:hypothetical protein